MNSKQALSAEGSVSPELLALLETQIKQNGNWIGFDRYMHTVLYTPGLGYYSGGLPKFGESGDFITAPELGSLFGQCLARQVAEVLDTLGEGSILEFGAGSGALAATVLNQLASMNRLPDEYLILELGGDLRQRQQETIDARAPELLPRVRWLDTLPEGLQGVVLANEVLDAMPVKVFEQDRQGDIWELGVALDPREEGVFRWERREADADLYASVRALDIQIDADSYRSEISLQGPAWVRSLGSVLDRGLLLLVDYGFRQQEYYHSDRAQGTLMCHHRHRAHDDPFFLPGMQDITAHVDFSAIAHAARESGFEVAGYATQGAFLLSSGLLQSLPLDAPIREQLELAQEVKKLTLPHEMGELFKVLALTRNYDSALGGFAQQDHSGRL